MKASILKSLGSLFILVIALGGCGTPCPKSNQVENLSTSRIRELNEKISKLSPESKSALLKKMQMASRFVPKQLFVKFKNSADETKVRSILGTINSSLLYQFRTNGALLIEVPSAVTETELLAVAAALNEVESVEYVHPNSILTAVTAPNDPKYGEQEDLNNTGSNGQRSDADIDAPEAWRVTSGSRSVVVGIIDTGIDYNHPDLQANIWTNPGESGLDAKGADKRFNQIDDDNNGFVDDFRGWDFVNNDNDPMDDNKHGTHVAGTIGAVGNNGVGIAGVNWQVSLVGIKFLSGGGSGSLSDAVKAIEYATLMNIPITNNSWGGGGYDATLEAAIRAARDKGALFVAAAGNNSSNNDETPSYPASYPLENIISVASVDSADNLSSFSNYGGKTVHVAAPGSNILSTLPGGQYGRLSGTSMASPHVAGVAALIKAQFPQGNYLALKARILSGSERLPQLVGKVATGRLNAANALENDTSVPSPVRQLAIDVAGITRFDASWNASGDDGTTGAAQSYEVKWAARPIATEADWAAARMVQHRVLSQSNVVKIRAVDLPLETRGFLTVRALDNVGNRSAIGSSIPFALSPPMSLFASNGESFENVAIEGSGWGQEEVPQRGKVFSESPGRKYENNSETAILLPPVKLLYPDMILSLATKISCESGFDWAYIEFAKNNETIWKEIESYSASSCDWANLSFQIGDKVSVNDTIRIRFRFKSDEMINDDGWLIDDIKLSSICFSEATGGNISEATDSSGTWRVHTFNSDGNLNVIRNCRGVDYLIVAGGGGGGTGRAAGGGGAGGLIQGQNYQIPALGPVPITVGRGGVPNGNGTNSSFGTLVASGGGRGGRGEGGNHQGASGGSGGGAGFKNNCSVGAGTAGQGNAGGCARGGNWIAGGGGGGAGAGGGGGTGPGAPANATGGAGGAGRSFDISGSLVNYAGGGGGHGEHSAGAAGVGGGGRGGSDRSPAYAGVANTGGGGGGGGGAGGSGVVIVRYRIR